MVLARWARREHSVQQMEWARRVPKEPLAPMVPMASQNRVREEPPEQRERMVHWVRQAELVPPEQRGRLGQRARLELPVLKARMGLLERRAQQVASRQWGCW